MKSAEQIGWGVLTLALYALGAHALFLSCVYAHDCWGWIGVAANIIFIPLTLVWPFYAIIEHSEWLLFIEMIPFFALGLLGHLYDRDG